MPITPDHQAGPSLEEEIQFDDRTTDGDPVIIGAVRRLGDSVRMLTQAGPVALGGALGPGLPRSIADDLAIGSGEARLVYCPEVLAGVTLSLDPDSVLVVL